MEVKGIWLSKYFQTNDQGTAILFHCSNILIRILVAFSNVTVWEILIFPQIFSFSHLFANLFEIVSSAPFMMYHKVKIFCQLLTFSEIPSFTTEHWVQLCP